MQLLEGEYPLWKMPGEQYLQYQASINHRLDIVRKCMMVSLFCPGNVYNEYTCCFKKKSADENFWNLFGS